MSKKEENQQWILECLNFVSGNRSMEPPEIEVRRHLAQYLPELATCIAGGWILVVAYGQL
jgi:hypothetical protein